MFTPVPINPIASQILTCLGGNKFIAMTGAHHLVQSEHSLQFSLPWRLAKDRINRVIVEQDDEGHFQMTFGRYSARTLDFTVVSRVPMVPPVRLAATFTEVTGLDTRLWLP